MKFIFNSKEQEKKSIANASIQAVEYTRNMIAKQNDTLVSKDVHYVFDYAKTSTGYKATANIQGVEYVLCALTKKGLKYLFAEFIKHMNNKLLQAKKQEIEATHNVKKQQIEATHNVNLDTVVTCDSVELRYEKQIDHALYYGVSENGVRVGTAIYHVATGVLRYSTELHDKQVEQLPANIYDKQAITDSTDSTIDDLYFKFRNEGTSDSKQYLYCTVSDSDDVKEFLVSSTGLSDRNYLTHVSELLNIVKDIDVFFLSDIKYNDILTKFWHELTLYAKEINYTISLYDIDRQQVVSLLEYKRLDVLFVQYFANYNDVQMYALFPELITPNGNIQSYTHKKQYSEVHKNVLHCKPAEFKEYKELLIWLRSLGYNLNVLNRN